MKEKVYKMMEIIWCVLRRIPTGFVDNLEMQTIKSGYLVPTDVYIYEASGAKNDA